MSIRYLYNLALAVAAGFLVVATQAWAPTTVVWLTFGIAVGVTAVSLGVLPLRTGLTQRILTGIATAIGIWTIVASLVFAPTTVLWLGFASALALVALALSGLTLHELKTERVVHSLDVSTREREPIAA